MNDTKKQSTPQSTATPVDEAGTPPPPNATETGASPQPGATTESPAATAAASEEAIGESAASLPADVESTDDKSGDAAATEPATAAEPAEDSGAEEDIVQDDEEDAEPSVEDQISELRDRLLRAMAELENTRKRAERDRVEANKYAVTGFARSILSVADNLRRAIESVPDDDRENETIKTLLAGIEMTERELLKVFEQQGVKSINPLGEKFDHNFHQAMFEVESTGQPAGTIVQVMEPGYVIAERLLRPAMVGIAKAQAATDQPDSDSPRLDTKV